MANILGINYYSYISRPDSDTFLRCMHARDNFDRAHGIDKMRDTIIHSWKTVVREWERTNALLPMALEKHEVTDGYRRARDCVRMQKIFINITMVQDIVQQQLTNFCLLGDRR